MEQTYIILQELAEIAPNLALAPKATGCAVPNGYFETLSDSIWQKIHAEQNMSLPTGYFDGLAGNVMAKIKSEENELENIAPTLFALPKSMPYAVPAGYFEQLNYSVPQVKVVKINWFKSIKFAAAAILVGVLAFGGIQLMNPKEKLDNAVVEGLHIAQKNSFDAELQKISDEDIIQYLQNSSEDLDAESIALLVDAEKTENVNDEDATLDSYLNTLTDEDFKN